MRLNGQRPLRLTAEVAAENDEIGIGLTNCDLPTDTGAIPRNSLYVGRLLSLTGPHLHESFTIWSYHDAPCEVQFELIFAADFADLFEVRGTHRAARGQLLGEDREPAPSRSATKGSTASRDRRVSISRRRRTSWRRTARSGVSRSRPRARCGSS